MQTMQTVDLEYIRFFGLTTHPFLLSPDPAMFHSFGQYYECMERLRYAIETEKGGALLVSEEAGLGKTTVLFSLTARLKASYGDLFRYALLEYPLLTPSELIAHIYSSLTGTHPQERKIVDLANLRESLERLREQGGRAIVVIDEAHLLTSELLQELRLLMNLQKDGTFLLTLVLSGQRPLWERIEALPELFQRLPVRYYLRRLRLEETKELLRGRLKKASSEDAGEVFREEAVELIHRYGMGIPRTVLVLADLCLVAGFENRVRSVGYREVERAITMLKGRTDGLGSSPAVSKERAEGRGQRLKRAFDVPSRPLVYGLLAVLFVLLVFVKGRVLDRPLEHRGYDIPLVVQRIEREIPKERAIVAADLVRVRMRPSTEAPVVAHLLRGETFEVEDTYVDDEGRRWYKVLLLKGKEGWLREDVASLYRGSGPP